MFILYTSNGFSINKWNGFSIKIFQSSMIDIIAVLF